MFDLHLLHLPPLNLLNIHLYYSETNYERAMKSPFCVCGKETKRTSYQSVGDLMRKIMEER